MSMNETTYEAVELAVCTDCLFAIANGDEPEHMDPAQLDAWTVSFERRTDIYEDVSIGHLDPADPDAGSDPCWTWTEDTYCQCEGWFSWRACEACGSTLGGTRYPAVGLIARRTVAS
jgi:hypothetical protein